VLSMKVLEVYRAFLPRVGGAQTHIYGLCRGLIERGHKPIVLAWEPSKPSFEIIDGIRVHRFWISFPLRAMRYPAIFCIFLQLIYLTRRYGVDIIHAHGYFHGIASALAGKVLNKPVVVTFHSPMWGWPELELPFYISPIEPLLKKYVVYSVAAFICTSRFTHGEMVESGFPVSKLKMIRNWVTEFRACGMRRLGDTLNKFDLYGKRFILSAGRLVDKEKAFSVLVGAFGLLMSKGYDLDLVIAGDGPDKEMLLKYSETLGVDDRVHFLGRVASGDLSCLYESCEVFAQPSRLEAFGLVVLEALSFGKPVVSTRVGGIPEIIEDGVNGVMVDGRPEAFASGIEKLLSDSHLKEDIGRRSREIISKKFSKNNCHATIDFLESISSCLE
jgi:glycosyltransferase involved in cell wall biosynthesis